MKERITPISRTSNIICTFHKREDCEERANVIASLGVSGPVVYIVIIIWYLL